MDAAAGLLLRWGYKRVTIDDVAEHAGIGKGTVYLHWRTREELFYAVILREQLGAIDEFLEAVRRDPRECLLHRFMRLKYLSGMRRPLIRAVMTGDPEIIGRLGSEKSSDLGKLMGVISGDYFELLSAHGLVRSDITMPELQYGVGAATLGFFTGDFILAAFDMRLSLERKADMLESTLERTFSLPATAEALRAVTPPMIEILLRSRQLCQEFIQRSYEARS
jgi:AcrR family transcriptional regulator